MRAQALRRSWRVRRRPAKRVVLFVILAPIHQRFISERRLKECPSVPKRSILCIDDEELGLRVRGIVLERAGYRVITANDGRTGLGIFAKEQVDAVVLDYFMPEMNGAAVAKEMRRMRPEVPILLLSAYVNLPPEVMGVVDCTILKGDGPEVLLAKVREALPPDSDSGEVLS
jgi:CheY-like chemotaxis protein